MKILKVSRDIWWNPVERGRNAGTLLLLLPPLSLSPPVLSLSLTLTHSLTRTHFLTHMHHPLLLVGNSAAITLRHWSSFQPVWVWHLLLLISLPPSRSAGLVFPAPNIGEQLSESAFVAIGFARMTQLQLVGVAHWSPTYSVQIIQSITYNQNDVHKALTL